MIPDFLSSRTCSRALLFLFAGNFAAPHALALPRPPLLQPEKIRNIRVSLGAAPNLTVSGYDLAFNGQTKFPGSSVFNLRCGTEPESGASYVEFGAGLRALSRLEITAPGGFLQLNEKTYRSRLTIIPQGENCLAVNTLDLEKYLAGVIAKEMSPSWPLEALKAQAVASRSYAIYQANTNKDRAFDVESSIQDQVYDGSTAESARSIQAVEATRGIALTYDNHALKAYFHANCGGTTEVPEFVWGGDIKAFRSVACPYHKRKRDRQQWSVRLTKMQVEGALKKIAGLLPRSFRHLASLEAGAPHPSKRLSDLAVSDSNGNNVLVSANAFRNAVGNTKLKSTAFRIHPDGSGGYELEGEGHGHGVGLCQVGARAMAELGRTYRQILLFYYPLAKIRSLL